MEQLWYERGSCCLLFQFARKAHSQLRLVHCALKSHSLVSVSSLQWSHSYRCLRVVWTPCSHVRVFQDCRCFDWNFSASQPGVERSHCMRGTRPGLDSSQISALVTQQACESVVSLSGKRSTRLQKRTGIHPYIRYNHTHGAAEGGLCLTGSRVSLRSLLLLYSIISLKSVERLLSSHWDIHLIYCHPHTRMGGVTSLCLCCQQSGDILGLQKCSCPGCARLSIPRGTKKKRGRCHGAKCNEKM